jgi:hypothetical protein
MFVSSYCNLSSGILAGNRDSLGGKYGCRCVGRLHDIVLEDIVHYEGNLPDTTSVIMSWFATSKVLKVCIPYEINDH